jgi:hypothetical protein
MPLPDALKGVADAAAEEERGRIQGDTSYAFPVIKNLPSGAATYTIPIEVPPGRGKIAPHLALTYNSYQRNSWIGVGWDLDVGAIQRSTKNGINYAADEYVFTVNGSAQDLVSRTDWGTSCYGARIEGALSKYYFNPTTEGWEVTAKDGTRYYYGSTATSRQTNGNGVFSWQLDRVEDTSGNYMTLEYWKNQGEIYLDTINYAGNGSLEPSNVVMFRREERTDVYPSFVSGSSVQTGYRLKTIEVIASGQLARKYELAYNYSSSTDRSLLSSVKQYGSDGITALPETILTWQEKDNTLQADQAHGMGGFQGPFRTPDLNGDGKTDIVFLYYYNAYSYEVLGRLSTGSGFQEPTAWGLYLNRLRHR